MLLGAGDTIRTCCGQITKLTPLPRGLTSIGTGAGSRTLFAGFKDPLDEPRHTGVELPGRIELPSPDYETEVFPLN